MSTGGVLIGNRSDSSGQGEKNHEHVVKRVKAIGTDLRLEVVAS